MIPYANPQTAAQTSFNKALSRSRVCVEQTFGQFKKRFSINSTGYRLNLENVPNCIVACAVLHNIAKTMNLPDIEDEENNNGNEGDENQAFDESMIPINSANERQKQDAGRNKRIEITTNRFGC
uniref:DDE Tnp4 domain-containing protein n=1 Tax=Ditylenchus dipsaci TaxID=166011 RepID=A0A915ECH0_9BILA